MKRRTLLQAGATLPALAVADRLPAAATGNTGQSTVSASANVQMRPELAGMNVVIFITDQQRAIMHFPEGWAETHLPGATRLQ